VAIVLNKLKVKSPGFMTRAMLSLSQKAFDAIDHHWKVSVNVWITEDKQLPH
jgi:hypothetical protein